MRHGLIMKALSVRQPWLYAILALGKRIENRTWYTDYRGPLLLHASRTFDWRGREVLIRDGYHLPPAQEMPRGAIIGVAMLRGVQRFDPFHPEPWAEGPFCWYLVEPAPLPPTPWIGRTGLFDVEISRLRRETREVLAMWLKLHGYAGTRWWEEVMGTRPVHPDPHGEPKSREARTRE